MTSTSSRSSTVSTRGANAALPPDAGPRAPRPVRQLGPQLRGVPGGRRGVVAVADEGEVAVGQPAQQVGDVGRAGAAGHRRLGGQRVGQLASAPDHGRPVLHDGAHVAQHPAERGLQVGRLDRGRLQVEVDPRLGQRAGGWRRRVLVGEHGDEVTGFGAPHHDDRVDHPLHLAAGPHRGGLHGLHQEGHVVGDDLHDQAAVGVGARPVLGLLVPVGFRPVHPDQRLPGLAPAGQLQVRTGRSQQQRNGVPGHPVQIGRVSRVQGDQIGHRGVHGALGSGRARHIQLRCSSVGTLDGSGR